MLALVAAAGLGWRYMAAPIAVAAVLAIPVGTVKSTDEGEVIFETDSEHQYIRVVEEPDGDRLLELNEGQAVHSLLRAGSYLTDDVWDGYLVLPLAGLGRPPERIAILGNAAGTTARGYGHYFPETAHRRRRDRPRARGGRQPVLRHGLEREPHRPQRGRPPLAAPLRGRLRRDLRRRLPPAVHPVLPGDRGVLRARPRPARPGRRRGRQRRAPRGQRRSREGARPDDGRGLPERHARPDRAHQHAAGRERGAGSRADAHPCAAPGPADGGPRTSPRSRPRASARGSRAARSTPTTAPRSSG